MILIDANQIAISHLMVRSKIENGIHIESIRKSIVRVLARIHKKFKSNYGDMVLCYDDKSYWRRQIFPYYKQNRKSEREKSKYDWDKVFSVLNTIRDEIRDNFPYQVIQVEGAEADDVIASLVKINDDKDLPEPVLILSADKDFIQLHKYDSVRQYDPIRNKWIEHEDPVQYLQEHIIKGDRSDGIPNILTCDDAFVTGKPQKKMSREKISTLASMDPEKFTNYIRLRNWKRNAELIDFSMIPDELEDRIIKVYDSIDPRASISMNYFIENNIQELIDEFA
jgi:5'-3' exonuclease